MRSAALFAAFLGLLVPAALVGIAGAEEKEKTEWPSLPVGSMPIDELGRDIRGEPIKLSDHLGKVVIVSFWASWCEPCRKELPVLAGVAKRVGPEHMKIIAINFKDQTRPFKMVVDILKDHPITMLRDANGKTARRYGVRAIPRMVIIGRDGKVAADHTGYGEGSLPGFIEQLNQLLAQKT
jgi:thiol-disulfide isomerase/thioredoxin